MANPYLASNLVASVKRRCFLSQNDSISNADFLASMTEEVQTYIASVLLSVRQEYLIATQDVSYAARAASAQVPSRAVAQGLRTAALLDGAGGAQALPFIEPERASAYPSGSTQYPAGYTLQGQRLLLVPAPSSAGTLRLTFAQRPGIIVDESEVGEITAINTGTKAVTLSATPSGWSTSKAFDFCSQQAGFQNWALEQAVTSIAANVLTFSSTLPADLAVGDYVCLAGQTPGPQCPLELYPLLCQRVAVKLCEAMSSPRLADVVNMLESQRQEVVVLLAPRVKDALHLIIRRDGPGFGRRC